MSTTIVTNQMFENQFLTGIEQNLQSELTDTQEIASGHRVNQPSDDPSALVQIVGYKTQLSDITGYQNDITSAKAPLESLDTSLSTLNNTLERANELAITSGSGTPDASSNQAMAEEVQQLYSTAVSIANTNVGGQYIFAGDNSNANPINPNTGELMSDTNSMNQNIGVDVNVTTNVQAGSLFNFARVNGTADSTTAIKPTYNWTNSGANTIPDADPVSALETAAPATGAFNSSNNILTTNGGAFNITVGNSTTPSSGAFVINGTNNKITTSAGNFTLTNGVYTASSLATALSAAATGLGINVSYDSTNQKFTITSNPAVNVNWGVANNVGKILGFSSAVVQTIGSGITSDNAVGDVNLAAGSTLQDARDAINTASAGVKAQVVNVGTSSTPDFRLVVASDPAGNSSNIAISPLSTALTTTGNTDPSGTGVNMLLYNDAGFNNSMILGANITNYNYITQAGANDSIVIDNGENGNIANNKIIFQENGGANITATIASGTYTHDQLATALATALTNAPGAVNTYTASYDPNAGKFIINNTAGGAAFKFLWSNASTTAAQVLGNNQTDSSVYAAGTTDITSNNPVLDNYYSFNNNYLNDKYILRALNFEQVSLQNNDVGRAQQAIQYTSDLSGAVSRAQSKVGATEDELNTESSQQMSSQNDIEVFLSDAQSTDLASVTSDLSLKQTALQALRTITTDVLSQSLFDFIKPS